MTKITSWIDAAAVAWLAKAIMALPIAEFTVAAHPITMMWIEEHGTIDQFSARYIGDREAERVANLLNVARPRLGRRGVGTSTVIPIGSVEIMDSGGPRVTITLHPEVRP